MDLYLFMVFKKYFWRNFGRREQIESMVKLDFKIFQNLAGAPFSSLLVLCAQRARRARCRAGLEPAVRRPRPPTRSFQRRRPVPHPLSLPSLSLAPAPFCLSSSSLSAPPPLPPVVSSTFFGNPPKLAPFQSGSSRPQHRRQLPNPLPPSPSYLPRHAGPPPVSAATGLRADGRNIAGLLPIPFDCNKPLGELLSRPLSFSLSRLRCFAVSAAGAATGTPPRHGRLLCPHAAGPFPVVKPCR
jgi:hypothetical protein